MAKPHGWEINYGTVGGIRVPIGFIPPSNAAVNVGPLTTDLRTGKTKYSGPNPLNDVGAGIVQAVKALWATIVQGLKKGGWQWVVGVAMLGILVEGAKRLTGGSSGSQS